MSLLLDLLDFEFYVLIFHFYKWRMDNRHSFQVPEHNFDFPLDFLKGKIGH